MKQKTFNIYIAAYLAILITIPGRFVYGFTLMIELLLLTGIQTITNSFLLKFKLDELKSFISMLTMISFSILFRQVLAITYSEIALTLGYFVFLPAVSLLLMYYLFDLSNDTLSIKLKKNMIQTGVFCITGLVFSLLRDLLGYGTFTFYGKNHQIFEIIILNPDKVGLFTFIASISGATILSGIFLFIQLVVKNKMRILKNAEVNSVVR